MNRRRILVPSLLVLALLAATGAAQAQPGPPGPSHPRTGPTLRPNGGGLDAAPSASRQRSPTAIHRLTSRTNGVIDVRSADITPQAAIPARHTAYGDNRSPSLEWTSAGGARAYVLLVEDPDAPRAQPFVHWVAWNIPPDVHALPAHLSPTSTAVRGMQQGRNDRGDVGWFGPRPPAGDPPHHYHFQVFALDRMLVLPPGATREDVLKAMDGHVLAKGELVATSQAPRPH